MAAIKALELWCKTQCDGYEEVSITNMTTSFKNGLAFCAIIHKYRPDLIDFKALSKEDTFENNNLAFRIAEEKLGIPALLDAEDMVALRIPDRLSILTYVSQYYNYFKGRSPLGGVKRPAEGSKEEPSEKKNLPVVAKTFVSKTANCSTSKLIADTSSKTHRAAADKKTVLAESSNKTGTLNSKCAACKNHVHLVQRNFVEGRLYHRSCFKCSECSSVLHPGAYKAGKAPDTFICNTPCKPSSSGAAIGSGPIGAVLRRNGDSQTHPAPRPSSVLSIPPKNSVPKPVDPAPPPRSWTAAAQKTQTARQRFFQAAELVSEVPARNGLPSWPTDCSGRLKVPPSREQNCKTGATIGKTLAEENCNNNNTRHFVIRTAERRFGEEPRLSDNISLRQDKCQPGPVGKGAGHPSISHRNKESPCLDAINNNTTTKPTPGYWNSKDLGPNHWQSMLRPVKTEPGRRSPETDGLATTEPHELDLLSKPPWNILVSTTSTPTPIVSPPVSVAVAPAYHQDLSPQKPQPVSENMGLDHGNYYSTIKSPSSWSAMQSIGSSMTVPENDRDTKTCCPASKKGKYLSPTNAPSPEMRSPSAKSHHIPMDQIERELDEIETNLSNLEREGVGLEEKLRSFEQEEKGDILMDPLMVDWFNLIRKKQMYIRRESELVYIVKTQDLEEQQPSVEEELRRLLEKPDCLKSTEEQQRQQSLMERLVEIVNGRNAIVEGLDEDRLREVEEDQRLNEMMQNLRVKKSKTKRTSSISKLFRRRSKRVVE